MVRSVVLGSPFKRDIRKHGTELATPQWIDAMHCLIHDLPLPEQYRNHPLKGDKTGIWDCHIKPDLVLLYRKSGKGELVLYRLGTHSEVFGS